MNIGFDLDKVFIDYPPLVPSRLIDRLYRKESNSILKYRIPSKPEQYFRLLTHFSFLRPPIKKNIAFIKSLKSKSFKYYLISSRFAFLKKNTNQLIQKHSLDSFFDDMFFNFENKQPHLFKNEIVKKLKIDRYIDDDLPLLEFLSDKNPDTRFFWLNKKKRGSLKTNLFAIRNLSEILK